MAFGLYASQRGQGTEKPAVPGIAHSSDYSLDGTLEPDDIPGMANSSDFFDGRTSAEDRPYAPDEIALSAGGPVRLPKQVLARNGREVGEDHSELLASMGRELKIEPPTRFRASAAHFEPDGKYALVQYRPSPNQQRRSRQRPEVKQADEREFAVVENDPNLPPEHQDVLRRTIRATLQANAKRPMTTQHNSPGDLLLMALPYGADAKVWQPNPNANPRDKSTPKGSYIYSIGTLCWNYDCAGKQLLRTDGQRVFARVGAGYQRRPASFLALLAMSNIMPNYEIKVNGGAYTIEHLVASEKSTVSKGMNLSMSLVGLSFYSSARESWKNEMGETWNIEKMVVEELNRSIDQGSSDVTDWLLGLTAAVNLFEEEGRALRGPLALAKRQIGVYQEFVLSVQNENYLWHPKFFLFKGVGPNAYDTLYSGGHVLRWLTLSMDDEQLTDVRVRKAVANLAATVQRIPTNVPAGTMTDRQLESVAVALQALSIYHQRVYGGEPVEEITNGGQSVAKNR